LFNIQFFMRKIPVIISFVILSISCAKEEPLAFSEVQLSADSFEACSTSNCPELNVQYLLATGNKEVSDIINGVIELHLVTILTSNQDDVQNVVTIKDAVTSFIADYKQFETDFGNSFIAYNADTNMMVSYFSEDLVSIKLDYYLFTGGAHGYGGTNYLNFNPKTAEILTSTTMYANEKEFLKYVENKFREEFQIPKDSTINATGFWFENDTFYLPQNVGFTESEVVLIYNQYEIASYAEGPILLTFPKEEVLEFLEFH